MFIPLEPGRPLGEQIFTHLREAIRQGRLRPGERLPSTRTLADQLGVSRNTPLLAYDRLISEGYVEGRGPRGTFVAADIPHELRRRPGTAAPTRGHAKRDLPKSRPGPALRLSREGRAILRRPEVFSPFSLTSGEEFPFDFRHNIVVTDAASNRAWNQILRRILRQRPASWKGYETSAEDPELQAVLTEHLGRTRGVVCDPAQVVILNGTQAAFHLVSRLLLDPGDRVVMEASHYLGVRNSFLARGATIVPVPIDEHGMRVRSIPESAKGAKLAYVVPSHQWPLGGTLPFSRRQRLLSWARKNRTILLENDHSFEYRHTGPPVESLQGLDRNDRVFHVGALARLRPGGLRLNYLVAPHEWTGPLRAALGLSGTIASPFEQRTLAAFIREGHLDRLNRRTRKRAKAQREAMVRAVETHLGDTVDLSVPGAGFHVHVALPGVRPEEVEALLAVAAQEGIRLYPDLPFHWRVPRHPGLILGFGEMAPARIDEAVARLSRVLARRSWAGTRNQPQRAGRPVPKG